MLFLQQIDEIGGRAHSHQAFDGIENDIELALGHKRGPTYEREPLNLSGSRLGAYEKTATMTSSPWLLRLASAPDRLALLRLSDPRFLQRVVGWHGEQRSIGFGANDVLQPIRRLAAAWVAVLRHQQDLQIRREPLLGDDFGRLQIADRAGRNRCRRSRTARV